MAAYPIEVNGETLMVDVGKLMPAIIQEMRARSKDVGTITKWGAGDFDLKYIYSYPVLYQDGQKTLHVQVLMSAIVKSLQDAANEELVAIKQQATEAADSAEQSQINAAASEEAAKNAQQAAEQQRDQTINYLNTVNEAELQRIQAEEGRANAESVRTTQESNRVSAETARANAETARANAENTRVSQESSRVTAESNRVKAEESRVTQFAEIVSDASRATTAANTAATSSYNQTAKCKEATDLAEELNSHPQKQGENGNWWKWNPTTNEYEDTGIIARGGVMYPRFRQRRNHVLMYDETDGFKSRVVRRRNHAIIKF